jgi:hypothetical protein
MHGNFLSHFNNTNAPHHLQNNNKLIMVIFVILADFNYFGKYAENSHITNFVFNLIIWRFFIPFIHSKVL